MNRALGLWAKYWDFHRREVEVGCGTRMYRWCGYSQMVKKCHSEKGTNNDRFSDISCKPASTRYHGLHHNVAFPDVLHVFYRSVYS